MENRMNRLARLQIDYNAASRGRWQAFDGHRRRLTELLRAGTGRLVVLGAGNCNDLDLAVLAEAYREVHLVDLDQEAMRAGVERQGLTDRPGVVCHDLDLTGLLGLVGGWTSETAVTDADVAACADEPVRLAAALPGPFDMAASTCLLSQLILGLVRSVTPTHPRFLELVQAVRAGHLRQLSRLTAPGGVGLFVTDVVSSESLPVLPTLPDDVLPRLPTELARTRNFFHGLNPVVLESLWRNDPVLKDEVTDVAVLRPWLWDFGERRTYLVWAARFRRVSGAPPTPPTG
jgi:hypothetical protein